MDIPYRNSDFWEDVSELIGAEIEVVYLEANTWWDNHHSRETGAYCIVEYTGTKTHLQMTYGNTPEGVADVINENNPPIRQE